MLRVGHQLRGACDHERRLRAFPNNISSRSGGYFDKPDSLFYIVCFYVIRSDEVMFVEKVRFTKLQKKEKTAKKRSEISNVHATQKL